MTKAHNMIWHKYICKRAPFYKFNIQFSHHILYNTIQFNSMNELIMQRKWNVLLNNDWKVYQINNLQIKWGEGWVKDGWRMKINYLKLNCMEYKCN